MINHGLALYFKAEILNELTSKCPRLLVKFVSAFDELFDRVSTTKQIHIHIIYFDEATNKVKRVYLNSQFLGHTTGSDMMDDFKKANNGLDIINNPVNGWAKCKLGISWRAGKYQKLENPKVPSLIVLGSYGLHILHEDYKTGQQQTNWDLESLDKIFKRW